MPGRRFLALIALLGCVAAGCSEADSDPPPDEPSSQPADDTQTAKSQPTGADVAVPTMPGRAEKDTLRGAEAFVRHYIDLLNYASDTGHVAPLKSASGRHCGGCLDYVELYKSVYQRGGYFREGDWIPQPQVLKQRFHGTVRLIVTVDSQPGRYRERASAPVESYGSNQYSLTFVVGHRHGRWIVRQFDGNET
ncbi:MAG: DUF6318 family protein [Actinomycetia bacterium]|nr:DUF6318 family protein [Actinomycetes bacterium]